MILLLRMIIHYVLLFIFCNVILTIFVVELELTDFVSGKDGDTLPRDKTDSDQLRGRAMVTRTSIPLTSSSTRPFVSMGDDYLDLAEHSVGKVNHDGFDVSVSCEAYSEVGTSGASQCVGVSCSSMVDPGQNTETLFSACKHLYSSFDMTRNLSSTRINQVAEDLMPVTGKVSGTSSTTFVDETRVIAK